MKHILKKILKHPPKISLIQNINCNLLTNQKKVLISYITNCLNIDFQRDNIYHTNIFEINQIIKKFIELDYCIDIVNCNDEESLNILNNKNYDLLFGLGKVFYEYSKNNKNVYKVLYVTENHPDFSTLKEKERIDYFYKRHKVKVKMERSGQFFLKEYFDFADAMIIMGEEKLFEAYNSKKYVINPTGFINKNYKFQSRNYQSSKKNFLWFGSRGAIHKGLDLLLDIFKDKKELNLHICGVVDKDEKQLKKYFGENIYNHGMVNVSSDEFLEIINKCSFVILPSCSEAMSTSVLTCMLHSMLPIVLKGVGFDRLVDNAIYMDNYNLETIKNIVESVSNIDNDVLEKMHKKTYDFSCENFTLPVFDKNLKYIINDIDKKVIKNNSKMR
jgi:hypothetical protein